LLIFIFICAADYAGNPLVLILRKNAVHHIASHFLPVCFRWKSL